MRESRAEQRRVALPEPFKESMVSELGAIEAERLFEALEGESPSSIRCNGAKGYTIEESPIGWSKEGYYLAERPSFTLDSAFHAGAYYVQEASSQFVGHILSALGSDIEGMRVLDCCAAPGGKSTLYSSLVGRDGLVVASEINRQRAQVLADNVRKWGLGNMVVVNGDAQHMSQCEQMFDVVAVDAPCSGEGMFRKGDIAREEWSVEGVKLCAERQLEILQAAWKTLRIGGTLLYSTCTFNRMEDEGTLERFQTWCDEEGESCVRYCDVETDDAWGIVRGEVGAFQSFRFMPHRAHGEGLFAAVACKGGSNHGRMKLPKSRRNIYTKLTKSEQQECERWVQEANAMTFQRVNETIYGYYAAQSEVIRRLSEVVNVIYSGVAIGEIFKGKLSPNEALALFVGMNREALNVAQLDEESIVSYLRKGDVAAAHFSEGLNLVVDSRGYSVGFAKRIGARVNNRYPNSLRILK